MVKFADTKAVSVRQSSLINCLDSFKKILNIKKNDRLLAVTPISFDIAQLEILLPLVSGATVILPSEAEINDPYLLKNIIHRHKPTILQTTPSKWELLLDAGYHGEHLKHYISGGETLSPSLAKRLLNCNPENLWNVYGPTETTIWSTYKKIDTVESSISIGSPIENTECLILNYFKKPLPMGFIGELYIGGAGVTKGYINADNDNAFLNLDQDSQSKFYRTGDLAYYNDNELHFVGRNDKQIKLRGYRIEPGEIENNLKQIANIQSATVIAHENKLIAYCVPNKISRNEVKFSLFYFAHTPDNYENNYNFILKSTQEAEKLGLEAVWLPERHFDPIGALFPNPALIAAAIAATTQRIKIRAGSVVLPINNSIRIAEDWAVVDNLSQGRVGVSFATGWHPNDFVLNPAQFMNRKEIFLDQIEEVRSLWGGKSVTKLNGNNNLVEIKSYPIPLQNPIPIWITAAASDETFELAGRLGANLLTHLLIQNRDDLKNKIIIYKNALQKAGFDPEARQITVMIHTYISSDRVNSVDTAYTPFKEYLKKHFALIGKMQSDNDSSENLQEIDNYIENAVNKFIDKNSLIGSIESCMTTVEYLTSIGVTEFACLIDFGIEQTKVIENLKFIAELASRSKYFNSSFDSIDVKKLQDMLATLLPHYMIPSKFHFLETLPLTAHGKIDTNSLIKCTTHENIQKKENQTYHSKNELNNFIENIVSEIWQYTLGTSDFNYDHSFFNVGGHSLKALQVINKIEERFVIRISLGDFFQNPTIAKLSAFIKNDRNIEPHTIESINDYDLATFPLSYGQESLWFMHQVSPDSARYNDSFSLKFSSNMNITALENAIKALHECHPILASKIIINGTQLFQNVDIQESPYLEIIENCEPLILRIIERANKPFELDKKLSRFILFVNEIEKVLLISLHHMITDGQSFEILINDLIHFYEQFLLPQNTPPTNDFYELEFREHIWLERKNSQLNFDKIYAHWLNKFYLSAPVSFINAKPRPNKLTYQGKMKKASIDHLLLSKISAHASQLECTLYVYLLSIFTICLKTISQDKTFTIGIPYANRESTAFEKAIGCFVNLLAVVVEVDFNNAFNSHAEQVLQSVLHAFDCRKLPFSKLVEKSEITRDLSYHPIFQIVFGMYDMQEFPNLVNGAPFELMAMDYGISRYDIEIQAIHYHSRLEFILRFNTDIFDDSIIEDFVSAFEKTIEITVSQAYSSLNDIIYKINSSETHPDTIINYLESKLPIKIDTLNILNDSIKIHYSHIAEDTSDMTTIDSWRHIYDKLYHKTELSPLAGWVNSANQLPYTAEEMSEWVHETIKRIKQLEPTRILEIGAGSGLLVEHLLPHTNDYCATDFSQNAINKLKSKFQYEHFRAYCCTAEQTSSIMKNARFDLIIMNSVCQYFPNMSYFIQVIDDALKLMDEGFIFIGDIKNSDLLIELHTSILSVQYPHKNNIAIEQLVKNKILSDVELSIPPHFILSLQRYFSKIANITLLTKKGSYPTEMNKFRYDCIISINKVPSKKEMVKSIKFSEIDNDLSKLYFETGTLKIKNVPNIHLNNTNIAAKNPFIENIYHSLLTEGLDFECIYDENDPYYFDIVITREPAKEIFYQTHHSFQNKTEDIFFSALKSYAYSLSKKEIYIESLQDNTLVNNKAIHKIHEEFQNQAAIQSIIANIWKKILQIQEIPVDKTFFELGGDSIGSIQMVARVRQDGFELTPQEFFANQTVNAISKLLSHKKNAGNTMNETDSEHPFIVSPIQNWLINQNLQNINHWNQAFLLTLNERVSADFLENIFNRLLEEHKTLRIRFMKNKEFIDKQFYDLHDAQVSIQTYPIANTVEMNEYVKILQSNLNIFDGPLFKIALFNIGKNDQRLLIIFHNLIMDGISWRILLDDIAYLWSGKNISAARSASYQDWINALKNFPNSAQAEDSKKYWISQNYTNNLLKLTSQNSIANLYLHQKSISITLSKSKLISSFLIADNKISMHVILLSTFVLAIAHAFNTKDVYIDMESHGRFDYGSRLDISRTLGWFTSIYPALFSVADHQKLSDLINKINGQVDNLTLVGPSFMPLKEFSTDRAITDKLKSFPKPEIVFNYFGEFEQSFLNHPYFKMANEDIGYYHDDNNTRSYILHFNAIDMGNDVTIELRYASTILSEDKINLLVNLLKHNLTLELLNRN